MKAVRDALAGQDSEAIQRTMTELGESVQKIGAAMYGEPEGEAAPPGANGEAPAGEPEEEKEAEGTVEGEFREVKEDEPAPAEEPEKA